MTLEHFYVIPSEHAPGQLFNPILSLLIMYSFSVFLLVYFSKLAFIVSNEGQEKHTSFTRPSHSDCTHTKQIAMLIIYGHTSSAVKTDPASFVCSTHRSSTELISSWKHHAVMPSETHALSCLFSADVPTISKKALWFGRSLVLQQLYMISES